MRSRGTERIRTRTEPSRTPRAPTRGRPGATLLLVAAAVAAVAGLPGLTHAATGGPDGFGYTFIDSDEHDGPVFEIIELRPPPALLVQSPLIDDAMMQLGFANRLDLDDDEVSDELPIGFAFDFYGVAYETVAVSSNGFLVFGGDQDSGCCAGDPVPDAAGPDGIVAGYWEDLDPSQGAGPTATDPFDEEGIVLYDTVGDEGERTFVVEFREVQHWPGGTPVTFQFHLLEATDDIEVHFQEVRSDGNDGAPATVGIEDPDGAVGLEVAHGLDVEFEEHAVRFVHP